MVWKWSLRVWSLALFPNVRETSVYMIAELCILTTLRCFKNKFLSHFALFVKDIVQSQVHTIEELSARCLFMMSLAMSHLKM